MTKRYVLSDASAARLRDVLRQHPGDARPRAAAGGAYRQSGFVRVTGAAVGGYYPCVPEIYLRDGATWEAFTAAKVYPANGEALASGLRYFALRVGDSAGVATWVTAGGAAGPSVQSETISADTNNLSLDAAATALELGVTGAYDLTGLSGGYPGRELVVSNVGSGALSLVSGSGSSSAGNRFDLPGGDATLAAGSSMAFAYVGSAGSGAWVPLGAASAATDAVYFTEASAPAAPATGSVAVYAKADGKLYSKDDAGTEYDLTASGARTEGTLAAAGSNQGTAAAIADSAVEVTGADGTKGVILEDVEAGITVVWNNSASTLKVYPPSGAAIGVGAANAADSLTMGQRKAYFRVTSTLWATATLV